MSALRTLVLVHRHKSFTATAAELDVKQSTVSYTIDRLRRALGDPLFVRQGGGIAATDRCQEAVSVAETILSEMEALAVQGAFDPSTATGKIKLAGGFYFRTQMLPQLLKRIRRNAPNLEIEVVGLGDMSTLLFESKVDLAVSFIPTDVNGIYSQWIAEDHEVTIMDRSHPLAQSELTLQAFAEADHLSFQLAPGQRQNWLREMENRGLTTKIAMFVPEPSEFFRLIEGSDLLGTMASRLASGLSDTIVQVACPVRIGIDFFMYWAASADKSPLNIWLRECLAEIAADLDPPLKL